MQLPESFSHFQIQLDDLLRRSQELKDSDLLIQENLIIIQNLIQALDGYRFSGDTQLYAVTNKGFSGDLKFVVEHGGNKWMLRCYVGKKSADLQNILHFQNFLSSQKYPLPQNIATTKGASAAETNLGTWVLTEYVEGYCPSEPQLLTQTQLIESAQKLAELHLLSAEYPLDNYPAISGGHLDFEFYLEYLSEIETLIRQLPALTDFDQRILKMVSKKRELLAAFPQELNTHITTLPQLIIHGDFHGSNLLFNESDQIASVLDWEFLMRWTRVAEVQASICMMCKTENVESFNAPINLEKARIFLNAYEQKCPLSKPEKEMMAIIGKLDAFRIDFLLDKRYRTRETRYNHLFPRSVSDWFWWENHSKTYEDEVINNKISL